MKTNIKAMLSQGLDLKEQSTKRAMNTANKNPAFRPIYEKELVDIAEAKAWLGTQKEE